jgi:alcohol dehydrogenase class IV
VFADGVLRSPRTILTGRGQRHALAPLLRSLGHRVLLCTDARMAQDEECRALVTALAEEGMSVTVYAETTPELPVSDILACLRSLAGHPSYNLVVGLGGGSCLDMAKVVALVLTHGGHPLDYIGELQVPGPLLPVVAVPTTAGTGSEATPVAVILDDERGLKVGISSPHLVPLIAVCDPELTYTCPTPLARASGADALTHLVESFTAIRRTWTAQTASERVFVGKSALTDQLALAGIRLAGESLTQAVNDPADTTARDTMSLVALYGGLALGSAGTAAAHAIQYPLGALTHTPHGLGVGALLPYVMRFNLPTRVAEFAEIAGVLGAAEPGTAESENAVRGVLAVDELLWSIGIPRSLSEMGLAAADVPRVVQQSLAATRLVQNNPRQLDEGSVSGLVHRALAGDLDFDV